MEQFYQEINRQISVISETDKKIVLYGTKEMAYYCLTALQKMGKEIFCYCDSAKEKHGTEINGKIVCSPKEIWEKAPEALVIVCSFNPKNVDIIKEKLISQGFSEIISGIVLFYYYQIHVMKRQVVPEEYAKTIYMQQHSDDFMVVGKAPGNLPIVITEKCNLRCRDCGVMIPYYEQPKNYDKEFIIKSIRSMAECVDLIETLNIIGGETFLYPDLVEVCCEAAKIENIFSIILVTNAAVSVKKEDMGALSLAVSSIVISDYGIHSPKKKEIYEMAFANHIYCQIFTDDVEWSRFYPPKKQNRTQEENERIFQNCYWSYHAEKIINGEFHLCDFAAAIAPFHILSGNEDDYLNLLDESLTKEHKRKKMEQLLYQTKAIMACDYCQFYRQDKTEKALQVKGTLKIEL